MTRKEKNLLIDRAKKLLEILKKPVSVYDDSYRWWYSDQLVMILQIRSVELRDVVRFLRRHNYPIGSGSNGYKYCTTSEEWEQAKDNLRNRYHSLGRTLNQMKQVEFHNQPTLFEVTETT